MKFPYHDHYLYMSCTSIVFISKWYTKTTSSCLGGLNLLVHNQGWTYQFIEAGITHSRPFSSVRFIVKQGKTIAAVNVAKDVAASGNIKSQYTHI